MNKRLLQLILFLAQYFVLLPTDAQVDNPYSSYSDIQIDDIQLERLINLTNEEIVDLYVNSQKDRYDINLITREELRSIRVFTESQINNFLEYRENWGPFRSIYELEVIDEFDIQTIRQFLTVLSDIQYSVQASNSKTLHQYFSVGSTRIIQLKNGFKADTMGIKKFQGDPTKIFCRYLFDYENKISIGLAAEKDEGEYLKFNPHQNTYVFDHISGYLHLKNIWKIKDLIIGDFRIQSGQGLVFSNLFSFGKGTETITSVRKSNTNVRPVSSTYEIKDFSGAAINLAMDRFHINLFGSRVDRDATLYSSENVNQYLYFKSVTKSGLHRTKNEILKKNAVVEKNIGININYFNRKENWNVGLNNLVTHFSLPIEKDPIPENKYSFSGNTLQNSSFYFNYYGQKLHIFSEIATSNLNGFGVISGLIHQVNSSIFLSMLYRNLQPEYHAFHGNVFAESSQPNNEKGFYMGLRISPVKNLKLNFYYDIFSFPWMKNNLKYPSQGSEWLTFAEYEKYKSFYVNFRCQYNSNLQNDNPDNYPLNPIIEFHKLNLITNLSVQAGQFLKVYQKIQYNLVNSQERSSTNGYLLTFGLNFQKERFGISTSFTMFDADNYQNKLYFFQRSVPHGYNYPFFQNQGSNINFVINYNINEVIGIWCNFNQTIYSDLDVISAGVDEIEGNKKSLIGFEIAGQF